LGRRRSVAGATSRRLPSARMRPGAGYLPTLALGRPRGPPTAAGAPRVMRFRTAPRQVYRVYSEAEFLAARECPAQAECACECDRGSIGACTPRPWGRVAAVAALSAASIVVAGVVALNEAPSSVGSERRLAGGRIAPRPPIADRLASGPAGGGGAPTPAATPTSSRPAGWEVRRRRVWQAPPAVRGAAERHAPADARAPFPVHLHVPVRSRLPAGAALAAHASTPAPAAVVVMAPREAAAVPPAVAPPEAAAAPSEAAAAAPHSTAAPTEVATTSPQPAVTPTDVAGASVEDATASAETHAGGRARSEFGFER
jgi:hypothetical protein